MNMHCDTRLLRGLRIIGTKGYTWSVLLLFTLSVVGTGLAQA